jgi:5-methylcytosine-specific restriction endonuclease McrA
MKVKNSRCLVLNADYSPLTVINWQRALVWSFKNQYNNNVGVEIIDFYKNDYIVGVNKKHPIPAVVKTVKYFRLHNKHVNFSRQNLFVRDNFQCQYCGCKPEIRKLTYDHVIPKSLWKHHNGSPTSWTNIVTACIDCNSKKANRTPAQAGMSLKSLPIMPNKSAKYLPVTSFLLSIKSEVPEEWKFYLPESYF